MVGRARLSPALGATRAPGLEKATAFENMSFAGSRTGEMADSMVRENRFVSGHRCRALSGIRLREGTLLCRGEWTHCMHVATGSLRNAFCGEIPSQNWLVGHLPPMSRPMQYSAHQTRPLLLEVVPDWYRLTPDAWSWKPSRQIATSAGNLFSGVRRPSRTGGFSWPCAFRHWQPKPPSAARVAAASCRQSPCDWSGPRSLEKRGRRFLGRITMHPPILDTLAANVGCEGVCLSFRRV